MLFITSFMPSFPPPRPRLFPFVLQRLFSIESNSLHIAPASCILVAMFVSLGLLGLLATVLIYSAFKRRCLDFHYTFFSLQYSSFLHFGDSFFWVVSCFFLSFNSTSKSAAPFFFPLQTFASLLDSSAGLLPFINHFPSDPSTPTLTRSGS